MGRTGRLVNDTRYGLGRVVRTVVRYVFVHSWPSVPCREGKKRLASWEVLHMLEEGVCARSKTEE
jgi:hypothetical protein